MAPFLLEKIMLPIQLLRKKDPTLRAALARRPAPINWEEFDGNEIQRKHTQTCLENTQSEHNRVAHAMAIAKRNGDLQQCAQLHHHGAQLNGAIKELTAQVQKYNEIQQQFVLQLPNIPHPDVPNGNSEEGNTIVRTVGTPSQAHHLGATHTDIAQNFGGLDAVLGAQLAHSRFTVMGGEMARLHRALIQMMLDMHADHGYTEMNVPYLVNRQTLQGTGQLPKFEDDMFQTTDGLFLIPTAEVPLTNLVANQILRLDDLPLAWCAHTPCFRKEAGSAGRDVHGLIRQHQFEKVELVRVEHPNAAEEALRTNVLGAACAVMDALELPYQIVELCAGDLGFAAHHTFDIEVWLPSQNTYREISSCSNMGDFQARRMNTRLKDGQQTIVPHTLNGSGLAVGRALVAVLENHIQADNRLYIPNRLRPYWGNRAYIQPQNLLGKHKKLV